MRQFVAATGWVSSNGRYYVQFIVGDWAYVDAMIYFNTKIPLISAHDIVFLPAHFNPNPFDPKRNDKKTINLRRAEVINCINDTNKASDKEYNDLQKSLIKLFNASLQKQITSLRAKIRAESKKKEIPNAIISDLNTQISILTAQKMTPALRKTPKVALKEIEYNHTYKVFIYSVFNPYITLDKLLKIACGIDQDTLELIEPNEKELEEREKRNHIYDNTDDDAMIDILDRVLGIKP